MCVSIRTVVLVTLVTLLHRPLALTHPVKLVKLVTLPSKASNAAAKTPRSDSHCTSKASNAALLALLVPLALTHPCIASSSSCSPAAATRFGIIGFMPRDTWGAVKHM